MKKKIRGFWSWIKKLSWKRKLLYGAILLVVILLTVRVIRGKKTNYAFDTVTRDTVTEVVTETGNVSVSGEYDVTSPATGILAETYVENGASVSAGQKLFKITSTATAQQKAAAWAAYAAAKSQLDAANAQLYSLQSAMFAAWKTYTDIAENSTYQNPDSSPNTSNRVLTPFTIAQDNWLSTEANFKNQQSAILAAQASATNAYLAYQATQDSVVTAPVSGTVHNLTGVTGATVNAPVTASISTVSPVLILSTGETFTIKTTVNEVDINKINIDDTASITFDAIQNKLFTGKIIQSDEFGSNAAGVVNYNVYASVDDGNGLIKPGMTANLSIDTNKRENVLTILNGAVRPYKGAKAVQVLKNGKVEYVPVSTGIRGLERTEITSGVTEGEKVIIGNTTASSTVGIPGR